MKLLSAPFHGKRSLSPDALNVAPRAVGLPLATPVRRALAMGVDLALIALLSEAGGFFLFCGLVLVMFLLRSAPVAQRKRQVAGWLFVGLLGLLAAVEAWDDFGPGRTGRLADKAVQEVLQARADASEEATRHIVEAAMNAASSPAARIALLEAEVAELKKPQAFRWRDELRRLFEAVGVSFGWGIVYFSLLPAWWNGQTLGKKWLQLQTVELTGRPLTVMRCLRRYGGYAAGMATGGLGFLQCLWDVNRQAIQDRVAHTVVVDLRSVVRADAGQTPAPD